MTVMTVHSATWGYVTLLACRDGMLVICRGALGRCKLDVVPVSDIDPWCEPCVPQEHEDRRRAFAGL
jgi:hypothetical protein